MSVSSDHDSVYKGSPITVYPVSGSDAHDAVSAQEAAKPVSAVASIMHAGMRQIDTAPIRWGWWAVGLGASALLWAGIVIGVF